MDNFELQKSFIQENIKLSRNLLGLAQERLALEAGVDRTLVSKIERGLANPTLLVMTKLADRLNLSVCELLCNPLNHPNVKTKSVKKFK